MLDAISKAPSAVDACAAALKEAILDGRAPPGSRLPPERTLAEQFGVNRVTVRGALERLRASGLVTVRQGAGYAVQDYRRTGGPDLVGALVDLARRSSGIRPIARDLLAVRLSLAETVLVRLAERPPTVAAKKRIRAAVDELERRAQNGVLASEIAEADIEAIGAVIDATGSAVLRLFLNPVFTLLEGMPELVEALYSVPTENVVLYRALIHWLEKPDDRAIRGIVDGMRARDAATLNALKSHRASATRGGR